MTLRVKLLLAQAPLAIALAVVGFLASANVASLGRHSEAILKDNYQSVLAAERLKDALERLEDIPALALIPGATEPPMSQAAGSRRRFEKQLQAQEGNITEPGERQATQELRERWASYQERLDRFQSARDSDERRRFFFDELEPAFVAVREAVDTILTINQDAMVRKSESARRAAQRMDTVMLLASAAALIIGSFVSTKMTTRLLQPLALLTRAVHRIGEGDFGARIEITGRDELAQLAATVNAMATRLSQYRRSSLGDLLLARQVSQAAIDSMPDPVVVFDLSGGVLSVNRPAETLLGLVLEAAVTDPLHALQPDVRALLERVRAHVLAGKGPYLPKGIEEAIRIATADGERYLLPRATPVYAEEGGIAGVTVLLQDVTRLRRVDELRNDLIATVAHEFRTPLTSLRMAIHLCLEQAAGPLTDQQADLLYAARDDCERLQSMIDELLDLARIQGGRIELHRRLMAPAALIDAAIEAHRKVAEDRHLVLQTAVLPGLSDVPVDRERAHIVLSNLLSNAIRHTPAGGSIEVRAKPVDQAVRFEVADSGEGIPPEYRRTIFEKFVRVPGTTGGAGLGLSISREIVEAHGGEIGVEETPGGGATFWFTLPTGDTDVGLEPTSSTDAAPPRQE